ncbi:hypothetical protein [uncultured Clostridium sp.]|jgi:hypothetical protein|nr:hypothetical protein [uncultured Clostridium sp.]
MWIGISVEEVISRACEKALPKIQRIIKKNEGKEKNKKRVRNRQELRGK